MIDKRNETRAKKNTDAKNVRISPTYWVPESERENALDAVRKALAPFTEKAKKNLNNA